MREPDKKDIDSRTTVAKTVAKPLDDTCHASTSLEHQPRARTGLDSPGRPAQNYGSEGHAVLGRTVSRYHGRVKHLGAQIVSFEDFDAARPAGRIVVTSGGFDPIHPGHISSLQASPFSVTWSSPSSTGMSSCGQRRAGRFRTSRRAAS